MFATLEGLFLFLKGLFEKRKGAVSHYSKTIQKKKILDFMVYRGWETHLVYTALNEAF